MTNEKIKILETGVPGLDALLGGGLPEFSFNIVGGAPGSGKTTFCQQIMFHVANNEQRALFFTAMGEPPLKMLRYQQQFDYFDHEKIEKSIRFVNLGAELLDENFDSVLARIMQEVKDFDPAFVFVDSFRSIINAPSTNNVSSIQKFVQILAMQMTNWHATTFLIGEYADSETHSNPIFTIADCILWFSQNFDRNAMVRKMSVVKMRGQAQSIGLHTFTISKAGVRVFPRAVAGNTPDAFKKAIESPVQKRLSSGNAILDEMLGGGIPAGYTILLSGPSGVGKTTLGTEFLTEGVRNNEHGLYVSFEKSQSQVLNYMLGDSIRAGKASVIDLHTLDLSTDETLAAIVSSIETMNTKRVFFDSISGFEMALAPEFRDNFRESLYRMTSVLTSMGATVLMSSEIEDKFADLRFSPFGSAFLVDGIVLMRYMELDGELKRVIAVVKLRGSEHSKHIRLFEITNDGVVIGKSLAGLSGMLSGQPMLTRNH